MRDRLCWISIAFALSGAVPSFALDGAYVTGLGGVTIINIGTEEDGPVATVLDTGVDISFGAVAGVFVLPNVALEGELGYAVGSDIDGVSGDGDIFEQQDFVLDVDLLSLNGNIVLHMNRGSGAVPFGVVGAGVMSLLSPTSTFGGVREVKRDTTTEFALNFGGGVTLPFGETTGLRVEFREFVIFDDHTTFASRMTAGVAYGF